MLHDPKYFNNPMEYQPGRFLKDGKLNPDMMDIDSVVFGFGRRSVDPIYKLWRSISHGVSIFPRVCPGRYFSNNSLYIIAACLLAVYEIKPPIDDQGNIIQLKGEFAGGVLV